MKKLLTTIIIFLSVPAFSTEHYVFESAGQANAALNYINAKDMFPITGKNAKTGQPAPNKQKTLRWSDAPIQRLDGKYVFPRIPANIRATLNPEETAAFQAAFDYTIEVYDNSWFYQNGNI